MAGVRLAARKLHAAGKGGKVIGHCLGRVVGDGTDLRCGFPIEGEPDDRVPVSDSGRVCEPQFMGATARFPIGPYVLASLLQCRVYLLHCFQLKGGYHIGVEEFAERIAPERSRRHAAYEEYAQKFATALEAQVIRAPLQWFNFYGFWGSNAED